MHTPSKTLKLDILSSKVSNIIFIFDKASACFVYYIHGYYLLNRYIVLIPIPDKVDPSWAVNMAQSKTA